MLLNAAASRSCGDFQNMTLTQDMRPTRLKLADELIASLPNSKIVGSKQASLMRRRDGSLERSQSHKGSSAARNLIGKIACNRLR
jgi:hypothetical protein